MLARMSDADLVHRNGLGAALCCSMKPVMVVCRSATLRWTLRLSCRSVSSAKKRSTWFSHDELVGVRCTCQRGRLTSQSRTSLVLCVA